jgi:hypothetical protein
MLNPNETYRDCTTMPDDELPQYLRAKIYTAALPEGVRLFNSWEPKSSLELNGGSTVFNFTRKIPNKWFRMWMFLLIDAPGT